MATWPGGQSTEHLPGFWLDSSNGAIRKCRWRNEFYEGSNCFYVGQITLEVLVGHSVKDLQQVVVQQTAGYMGSVAQGRGVIQEYRLGSHQGSRW